MNRIKAIALGIWCAVTSFVSPIWLVLVFLYLTGEIYKYDFSMDEGAAGILGFALLVIWLLIVLLPDILFIKKMRSLNQKYLFPVLAFILLFAVIGMATCNWDIVAFLTTPGGVKSGVSSLLF